MTRKRAEARSVGHGWIGTLLGAVALAFVGFAGGMLAGLMMEEPELVLGHLSGRSVDVALPPAGGGMVEVAAQGEPGPLGTGAAAPAAPPALGRASVSAPPPTAALATRGSTLLPPVGGYAIQVGAFRDEDQARSAVEHLHGLGFPAYLVEGREAAVRYRVRVGPVESRAGAERLARRLRDQHDLPTWIVRREG